ncbi:MAG TPA: site-2 protease family protein [Clostridia bacterium]
MGGILVGILLLSIIMILHELGHFTTGLLLGFKVEEFSLFMGPVLYSREKNGIRYTLRLLPIGASCRFAGEEENDPEAVVVPASTTDAGAVVPAIPANADADILHLPENAETGKRIRPERARFYDRPRRMRFVVLSAGAGMNYLSGVLAFFILFAWFGFATTTVAAVGKGSQADTAGLLPGERILSVNGSSIVTQLDFAAQVLFLSADQPVALTVKSAETGVQREVSLVPVKQSAYRLGITIDLSTDKPVITAVDPTSNNGSPVLKTGDVLQSVNGVLYTDQTAFAAAVNGSAGAEVTVRVLRDGQPVDLLMKPVLMEYYNGQGIQFLGGRGVARSALEAVRYSWSIVRFTVKGLSMMIAGKISAKDSLSGPIGIVSMVGSVVEEARPLLDKIYGVISLFGLISVGLAFSSLLPIPPLDGNHLLLTGIEAIRRKRLSTRIQTAISVAGFTILIGLSILMVVFDVMRLTGH